MTCRTKAWMAAGVGAMVSLWVIAGRSGWLRCRDAVVRGVGRLDDGGHLPEQLVGPEVARVLRERGVRLAERVDRRSELTIGGTLAIEREFHDLERRGGRFDQIGADRSLI